MTRPLRILLIEDSEDDAELLLAEITSGGFDVTHTRVDSAKGTVDALATGQWDIVISDYTLPQFNGLAAIEIIRIHDPDLPIIITSGNIGEDIAVDAMRAGARDYLMKNNLSRLTPAIDRELRESGLRRDARRAQIQLEENEARFRAIVSNIPGMVFQLLADASGSLNFTYVSEGSKRLLDMAPDELRNDSARFFDQLLDREASGLLSRIVESTQTLQSFNWEGSIRGRSDENANWIIARMSPHRTASGHVQWDGILQDISRRKRVELELLQSQKQLSALSSHLQKAKESERTSIAREVHDDIGGNLTAIKIDLLWLINHGGTVAPAVQAKIHSLEFLIDRTMEITSRIARDLRPPLLDLGLLAAVEWEAAEFAKRMEIPCLVHCDDEDIAVDPELANALFSVFREVLTNVSKHAGATCVDVHLKVSDSTCTLTVTDNGRGFTQTDLLKDDSFGLRGMLERARNLGGEIKFSSSPGAGTTVVACLPLDHTAPLPDNIENATGSLWLEL
ncbi:MAG: response regulator [Burkholderiales bacterium]